MFSRVFLTCTFLIFVNTSTVHTANDTKEDTGKRLSSIIEKVIDDKGYDFVSYVTKRLEAFNDEYFGKTEIGRMVHYEEIKPKLDFEIGRSKLFYKFYERIDIIPVYTFLC